MRSKFRMENYLHAVHAYEQNFSPYSPVIFERNFVKSCLFSVSFSLRVTFKIVSLSICNNLLIKQKKKKEKNWLHIEKRICGIKYSVEIGKRFGLLISRLILASIDWRLIRFVNFEIEKREDEIKDRKNEWKIFTKSHWIYIVYICIIPGASRFVNSNSKTISFEILY